MAAVDEQFEDNEEGGMDDALDDLDPDELQPASDEARRWPVPAGSTSTSPASTSNGSPWGPPSSIVARPATTASAS